MTSLTALSWHIEKDSSLEQTYEKQIFLAFYYEDLKFKSEENAYLK